MPIAPAAYMGGYTAVSGAQGATPSPIFQDFDLDPEVLFEAVNGITFRNAVDAGQVPSTTIELMPPWRVKLPGIELDAQRLRAIRRDRFHLSYAKFATLLRQAGDTLLVPNKCDKRLVQKWESGEHKTLTPAYQLALAYVLVCDVETIRGRFPAARPQEIPEQLVRLARLAEALIVLADAYEKLRELNERLTDSVEERAPERMCPGCLAALTIKVPYAIHLRPQPLPPLAEAAL